MSAFVDGDGRNIGIDVDGVGEWVVVITTEESSWEECFTGDAEDAEGVSPASANGCILGESFPVIAGVVLVEADFDGVEFVVIEVFSEGLFGGGADAVIFDTSIEEDNFRGDPPNPAEAIDEFIGASAFESGPVCESGAGEVLIGGAARIRLRIGNRGG
jgi:hypothetical protein